MCASRIQAKRAASILLTLLVLGISFLFAVPAQAQGVPQARALLFYSPNCPHCHYVITEFLPTLSETYREQLLILLVDASQGSGAWAYGQALQHFEIPEERWGVPLLLIGDYRLVGSLEIEQELPAIIDRYLGLGGVDWPHFPGLEGLLEGVGLQTPTEIPTDPSPSATAAITWLDRYQSDPVGNSLAVAVLLALVASVPWNLRRLRAPGRPRPPWPAWIAIVLVAAGIGVAAYLSWIELTLRPAVCGPVGDCNIVQQSEYARLFGVLPVGVLGLIGYLLIGMLWLADPYLKGSGRLALNQIVWAMALLGVLFSIYLTYLEPFVIGATCIWCLSSALLMGLIFSQATTRLLWSRRQKLSTKRSKGKSKGFTQ